MARELKVTKAYISHVRDKSSGQTYKIKKIMDISNECPRPEDKRRCMLLYIQTQKGIMVQIRRPDKNNNNTGTCYNWLITKRQHYMGINHPFRYMANQLGLSMSELYGLIKKYAPYSV